MRRNRSHRTLRVLVVMLALIAGLTSYIHQAKTATVPGPAGFSSTVISGYAISMPDYTFSADGQNVNEVDFTLDAPATTVQAALVANPTAADWQDCGPSDAVAPYVVRCVFNQPVPVSDAVLFSVSASG